METTIKKEHFPVFYLSLQGFRCKVVHHLTPKEAHDLAKSLDSLLLTCFSNGGALLEKERKDGIVLSRECYNDLRTTLKKYGLFFLIALLFPPPIIVGSIISQSPNE